MMKRSILFCLVALVLLCSKVWASSAFTISEIDVTGNQRVSTETILSYLPVKVGDILGPSKTSALISALYQTGFFEKINLKRRENALVISVIERPTIGKIKINGNVSIKTDRLNTVLKSVGVVQGHIYDNVTLEKIRQSLQDQYYLLGRYNARVTTKVSAMPRNRLLVTIDISEGLVAKVKQINIIGNHAFDSSTLIKQFDLSTSGLITFFTRTDRFSQEKFEAGLTKLRDFYMNHGYIRFAIKSSQVAMTTDHKSIFITVVVNEGSVYRIKDVHIEGQSIIPEQELLKKNTALPGSIFSRSEVIATEKAISDALGNKGYIYAEVDIKPIFADAEKKVSLIYVVKPGKLIYVRHVTFTDNNKTNDNVLRRESLQLEGQVISTSRLDDSKSRMGRLPFIRDVQTNVTPVPGTTNQVDVNYKVKEDSASQASLSLSYGQLAHLGLGVGLNQKNFLGTGETLGVNLTRNRFEQAYGIDFTNPYYTEDGISRSISLSVTKFTPEAANLSQSYSDNQYSLSVLYGIPVGQETSVSNRIQLGYGYEQTQLHLSNLVSNQVKDFVKHNGRQFRQLELTAGYSRDSRDHAIFPTQGALQTIGLTMYAPLNSQSLKYYLLNWNGSIYHPIVGNFIGMARANLGLGNSLSGAANFPFFRNFYAGGVGSVRGYTGNTLGPTDTSLNSSGDVVEHNQTGGNAIVAGSIGLIFPNFISDSVRTLVFVDGGNVYNTWNNKKYLGGGSGPLRYSSGVELDWLSPLGPIELSVAKALNSRRGDSIEFFQFSLGANFG